MNNIFPWNCIRVYSINIVILHLVLQSVYINLNGEIHVFVLKWMSVMLETCHSSGFCGVRFNKRWPMSFINLWMRFSEWPGDQASLAIDYIETRKTPLQQIFNIYIYIYISSGSKMHKFDNKLFRLGLDGGFSPVWHRSIIWIGDGLLWPGPLAINFNEIEIKIQHFPTRNRICKCSLPNGGYFVSAAMY